LVDISGESISKHVWLRWWRGAAACVLLHIFQESWHVLRTAGLGNVAYQDQVLLP